MTPEVNRPIPRNEVGLGEIYIDVGIDWIRFSIIFLSYYCYKNYQLFDRYEIIGSFLYLVISL